MINIFVIIISLSSICMASFVLTFDTIGVRYNRIIRSLSLISLKLFVFDVAL